MSDLFEIPPPPKAAPAPKKRNRLEYYNNGPDCKKPKTQYGLVWDINNSVVRINFNSHLIDIDQLGEIADNPSLPEATQQHLCRVGEFYCELGDRDYHLMFGKINGLSGTGQHNLKAGIKDLCFGYAAIMRINPGRAPDVWLYDHGSWHTLTCNWQGCANSSHPAKLWEVRW